MVSIRVLVIKGKQHGRRVYYTSWW
jgi:hypothetical protein